MRLLALSAGVAAIIVASMSSATAANVGSPSAGDTGKRMAQQCFEDLQKFDQQLWRVGFGVLSPAMFPPGTYGESAPSGYSAWGIDETPRQKIRSLRDAAYVFALDGDEQSCQKLLASMRKVYQEHQAAVGSEADDPNVRTAWRRAHLARSKPVTAMNHLMRADILIGSEVRNLDDDRLGEVKDLVLNPEKHEVLYVLVSRGGFLGFGEKLVVVPWPDLRATDDHELYALDVTPAVFAQAPSVDRETFTRISAPDWQHSLSDYWDHALKK